MPDLRRKEIDAMQRARGRKDDDRIAEIMRKARERMGWTLGKEYELPAPIIHGAEPTGEGAERSFAHMRRGHLRIQPSGPGRKDVKLVFVRPTIVRPDLPFRPSPIGYKITESGRSSLNA